MEFILQNNNGVKKKKSLNKIEIQGERRWTKG